MCDYTINDALNILYRCGIKTHGSLKMYLRNGGFQISDSSLWNKLSELKQNGNIVDGRKGNSGRKAYMTQRDKNRILDLMNKEPEYNASEIKSHLKLECAQITISRFLKEAGFKFLRITPVPRLTPEHKETRITFARNHLKDNWNSTFFLDESKFQVGSFRKACYQKPTSRRTVPVDKHPVNLNLLGMISAEGGSRLIIFEENLNAELFEGFLKDLKQDADRLYGRRRKYRFAMDRDPKHTARRVQEYMRRVGLDEMADWPPSSPDLNPIENIWGMMEKELKKLHVTSKNSLKAALLSIWAKITQKERLQSYINSMTGRLRAIISRNGEKINY